MINALGYLDGTQVPQQNSLSVSRPAPEKEYNSLTLVVSGHAPGAQLIDLHGNVIHKWGCTFDDVWPGRDVGVGEPQKHFWRRVHLYPDGSVLAIFEYLGAVKLDVNSRIIWAKENSFNHDIAVTDDGMIYMLEQKPTARPAVNPELKIMDDHVTRLTPDGAIIDSVSLVDCVLSSPCRTLMDRVLLETADIFHSNTLKVITQEQARVWPVAKPGMVLVSFRELHTIALIDQHDKKVVWWSSDVTRYQHEPIVTPRGTIMMFDNIWCPGRSRVVEIDPSNNAIVWQYSGTPQQPFYSLTCSMVQYLPNGNLMVTSSDEGRAFSIDVKGKLIWEYVNPHRAGPNDAFIATLFQCTRLPKDFPTHWADPPTNADQAKTASLR
ncbi:MAG: aryl-sulfate sulfotransferase [Candidatus Hydrogenedentes bacterium]|nr:aryl-sulfate sulfotransferase [Candidatus Hydrogenedentota bacterium]